MEEFLGTPYIYIGLEAGERRAIVSELRVSQEILVETGRQLRAVIEDWPEELNERFLVLFVENVTVAALARNFYREEPLSVEDLASFFQHSAEFFNSFSHRHGDRRS